MFTLLIAAYAATSFHRPSAAWEQVAVSPAITISLPSGAAPITVDHPSAPGQQLWTYADKSACFIVSTQPLTAKNLADASPDIILGNAVIGACNALSHPNIKLHRDVLFNGWPGIETLIVSDNSIAQAMRTYVVGSTLYLLSETYSATSGRPDGVDTFMNSLVINPTPASGPQQTPGPVFKSFAPDGGQFSIGMPAAAKADPSDPSAPKDGNPMHQFQAQYGDRFYSVAYLTIPSDAPSATEVRAYVQQKFLEGLKAKPLKSTTATRGGQEFSTAEFTQSDLCGGRLDVTVAGGKVYLICMIYPTGHVGSKDIEEFFSSFHALPATPAGGA